MVSLVVMTCKILHDGSLTSSTYGIQQSRAIVAIGGPTCQHSTAVHAILDRLGHNVMTCALVPSHQFLQNAMDMGRATQQARAQDRAYATWATAVWTSEIGLLVATVLTKLENRRIMAT